MHGGDSQGYFHASGAGEMILWGFVFVWVIGFFLSHISDNNSAFISDYTSFHLQEVKNVHYK